MKEMRKVFHLIGIIPKIFIQRDYQKKVLFIPKNSMLLTSF